MDPLSCEEVPSSSISLSVLDQSLEQIANGPDFTDLPLSSIENCPNDAIQQPTGGDPLVSQDLPPTDQQLPLSVDDHYDRLYGHLRGIDWHLDVGKTLAGIVLFCYSRYDIIQMIIDFDTNEEFVLAWIVAISLFAATIGQIIVSLIWWKQILCRCQGPRKLYHRIPRFFFVGIGLSPVLVQIELLLEYRVYFKNRRLVGGKNS